MKTCPHKQKSCWNNITWSKAFRIIKYHVLVKQPTMAYPRWQSVENISPTRQIKRVTLGRANSICIDDYSGTSWRFAFILFGLKKIYFSGSLAKKIYRFSKKRKHKYKFGVLSNSVRSKNGWRCTCEINTKSKRETHIIKIIIFVICKKLLYHYRRIYC